MTIQVVVYDIIIDDGIMGGFYQNDGLSQTNLLQNQYDFMTIQLWFMTSELIITTQWLAYDIRILPYYESTNEITVISNENIVVAYDMKSVYDDTVGLIVSCYNDRIWYYI